MTRADRPTVFCLHFLGGSAGEWAEVVRRLEPSLRCVPLDLAGFGDAAQASGYAVAEMADAVAAAIRAARPGRWLLAGHSMGAKVATALARRAEDGESGLGGLAGVVLLAGSPPAPEPIEERLRQDMLGWFAGDADVSRAEAGRYIDANHGGGLHPVVGEQAVAEVLRANPAAWRAWLEAGSREDWSERVGVLRTPALAIAGAADPALGPEAQRRLMAPHFTDFRLVTLPDAGHLLPIERPEMVARLIAAHAAAVLRAPAIGQDYQALIHSDRVSARTRAVLLARAQPDDPAYRPSELDTGALGTLRAVVDRVLPQPAGVAIDLAARVDPVLAVGDGWRFALLPPDPQAYGAALRTLDSAALALHGQDFAALAAGDQHTLLEQVAAGEIATAPGLLDPKQMQLWFEDLRSDAVRLYMAHPGTMARIGYSGIGYGGDGEPKSGFVALGVGERDAWEPVAAQ